MSSSAWLRAWRFRLRKAMARLRAMPPGLRALAGFLLMLGGVFGFLPVLGFWMLPVGAMLVWWDLRRAAAALPVSPPRVLPPDRDEEDGGERGGGDGPGSGGRDPAAPRR